MGEAVTEVIAVGDCVEVVKPDPEYGIGCMAAGYDAAYRVTRVEGSRLYIETRLPLLCDPILVTIDEVRKSTRKPWWEEKETLWHA